METANIYTSEDLNQYPTPELVPLIADASSEPFELQMLVKQVLKQRMLAAKLSVETLKSESSSQRAASSRIYRMMILEEVERLETIRNKEKSIAKEDRRMARISGRKKAYKMQTETLIRPDKDKSIFKIKKQWINTGFIQTLYSSDYPSERTWFEGEPFEMLQNRIQQTARPYELFEKGSDIRKSGFNGYRYNMDSFNRDNSQLCWFAIYLNNVLEQQPNGEFWSMEVFSWGKRRGNKTL